MHDRYVLFIGAVLAALTITSLVMMPVAVLADEEDPAVLMRWTLVDWLDCTQCEDGEFEAVVALGESVVPSLSAALELGPSPASHERLRLHLVETYRSLVTYAETHPEAAVTMSEGDYVATYLENHRARHQKRAAEALGKIGGTKARMALTVMSQADDLRPDVRAVVEAAIRR